MRRSDHAAILSAGALLLLIMMIPAITGDCACKNRDLPPLPPQSGFPVSPAPTPQIPVSPEDLRISGRTPGPSTPLGMNLTTAVTGAESAAQPVITSLFPPSGWAGSCPITLVVDGDHFVPESRVIWDTRDYTGRYLSRYQVTAEIPAFELGIPGTHYVWVENPQSFGGRTEIATFLVRDSGRSLPLLPTPDRGYLVAGERAPASFRVEYPAQGLESFTLILEKNPGDPFTVSFTGFPAWVSDPQVTQVDENLMMVSGKDAGDRITNLTAGAVLVNLTLYGSGEGSGFLHCSLSNATTDDGRAYGSGYTAIPVISRELKAFSDGSGGEYQIPTDPDGDGRFEDVNGNERADFSDVVLFFENTGEMMRTEPWWLFDFDSNQVINLNDVIALFRLMA